ncbi:MAG TPA: hypothetical protein VNK82_13000 [Terriglobales bacterium]|nr:hypothetical protein [Terriglobales bacterium]
MEKFAEACGGVWRRDLAWSVVWAVLFVSVYAGAAFITRNFDLSVGGKVAVILAPAPFFALLILAEVRMLRRLDELQQRIQLEALAIAFPLTILLLMTLGLLQRVVTLSLADWSFRHVVPMVVMLYFIGLGIARRRYQ